MFSVDNSIAKIGLGKHVIAKVTTKVDPLCHLFLLPPAFQFRTNTK